MLKNPGETTCEPESEQAYLGRKLQNELEDLVQLRPMPGVAQRLMELCRDPQPDINEIVETIQQDPAIAIRVLAVANSPLYGYSREITSVQQAIVVLGFRSLCQLTVTLAASEVFCKGDVAAVPRKALYEHSLACATIARLLTPTEPTLDAGSAFLAGMLHDVGKLVFLDLAPDGYTQLRVNNPHQTTAEAEEATFGMSHTEIGKAYGETWGLPFEINVAIAEHHTDEDQEKTLASIASLASSLSRQWGFGGDATVRDAVRAAQWAETVGEAGAARVQQAADEQFTALRKLCC